MRINIKYIWFIAALTILAACESDDDSTTIVEQLPALSAGNADFSNYVSVGNSLTAGFTDNALFIASQNNSFPNMLSNKFSLVGGGAFVQPLMNDNFGGLLLGGNRIADPRLVTTGGSPLPLESVIGPVAISTDLAVNNPTGPFNNMGVPGAKSFHLVAPGYGNVSGLLSDPVTANPYFVRMTGATPNATVLELAAGQAPSFFSLWIGNNDVLGYALAGGDATVDQLTDQATFDAVYSSLISNMTAGGAQGIVANIPNVTAIPHFTTVPHNPLDPTNPSFGPLIPLLNTVYGSLNQIYEAIGQSNRSVVFATDAASAVVIRDEDLTDISATIAGALAASDAFPTLLQQFGLPTDAGTIQVVANLLGSTYGQTRQATADDLLVLPSSSVIGTANADAVAFLMSQGLPAAIAGQFSVEGVTLPLADKWVITPEEQTEIANRTAGFNATIESLASGAGLAVVDANALLDQLASGGIATGDFILTSDLVLGGAFSLDGVHPTARGYALIANEMMKAIDTAYGSNFEASGNLLNVGDFPTNYSPTLQ